MYNRTELRKLFLCERNGFLGWTWQPRMKTKVEKERWARRKVFAKFFSFDAKHREVSTVQRSAPADGKMIWVIVSSWGWYTGTRPESKLSSSSSSSIFNLLQSAHLYESSAVCATKERLQANHHKTCSGKGKPPWQTWRKCMDEDEELIVRKMERNWFFKQQTSFERTDSLKRKIKRIPNSGAWDRKAEPGEFSR